MSVKHTIRHPKREGDTKTISKLSRKQAVRSFCIECMGFQPKEVRICTDQLCPLFPFRMGTEKKDAKVIASA